MRLGRSVRRGVGLASLVAISVAATSVAALAQSAPSITADHETVQITPGGLQANPAPSDRKSDDAPRLKWRDMLFLNSLEGAGANLLAGDSFRLGFSADEQGRDALSGGAWNFGVSDRAYSFGAYGELAILDDWSLGATVTRSMTGGNGGLIADIGLKWNATIADGWSVEVGPSISWATGDYVQGLFGPESRGAGLQLYDASPGFKDLTVSGSITYSLSESWTVGGMIGAQRFLGDVSASPVVKDEKNIFGGISFGYRF